MKKIDYNYAQNFHSVEGPSIAFQYFFPSGPPNSLLDVGCGLGTWLKTALLHGVNYIYGIDGSDIPVNDLLFPEANFCRHDLTETINLQKKFDAAICLEVAEHLDSRYENNLINILTTHSDHIIFSAACPNQHGQNHVNCRWPEHWQNLFNDRGYVCNDDLRWSIWSNESIEPWYRQNVFTAIRNADLAGHENRIPAVQHPDVFFQSPTTLLIYADEIRKHHVSEIEAGSMPASWYIYKGISALAYKAMRAIR